MVFPKSAGVYPPIRVSGRAWVGVPHLPYAEVGCNQRFSKSGLKTFMSHLKMQMPKAPGAAEECA